MFSLVGPEQPSECLTRDAAGTRTWRRGRDEVIERVGFALALRECALERSAEGAGARRPVRETKTYNPCFSRSQDLFVARRCLGYRLRRIDGIPIAADDIGMKAVLHVRRGIGRAKEAPRIAFVFAKENFRIPLRGKPHLPQRGMFRSDYLGTRGPRQPKGWFGIAGAPGPGIAKPKSREEMQRRLIRPAVDGANPDEYVVYVCFGVLDEYVEVAILVEDACMDQLELRLGFSAPAIFFHNPQLPLTQVRAPALPVFCASSSFL